MYSNSRLSTFEQCPLRYNFRDIDKIIPEVEKSIEAHLGTCVHDTLEWLYKEVKTGRVPTIDDLIIHYSEVWQKEFKEEFKIVKKELTAKDYFNKGVEFILNYYTANQPFQDGTIELEKKVFITLKDQDGTAHKIIGFIDRLAKNPKTGAMEVHDYKTANSLPSQDKMDKDRQLALYSIAIKDIVGKDTEINLIWHYLAHKTKIISKRTNEQLEKLKKETIELIKKVEAATEFPANEGVLCHWCEYQSMCPKFNREPNQEEKKEHQTQVHEKLDKEKYPTISKYIQDWLVID